MLAGAADPCADEASGALAQGATIEEIMDVLKLCGGLGVDACELGAPILAEELASHQKRS